MKYKLLVAVVPFAVALATTSADASVRGFTQSGVGCLATAWTQPDGSVVSQELSLDRDQWGVHSNRTDRSVDVECPINISFITSSQPNIVAVGIIGYDRNPSTDLTCVVERRDGQGNITYSAGLSTHDSGPGFKQDIVSPSGVGVQGYWTLHCSLPAVSNGNISHLTNYYLQTNE